MTWQKHSQWTMSAREVRLPKSSWVTQVQCHIIQCSRGRIQGWSQPGSQHNLGKEWGNNKTLLPSHTEELGHSTTLQGQSRDYLTPGKMVTVSQTHSRMWATCSHLPGQQHTLTKEGAEKRNSEILVLLFGCLTDWFDMFPLLFCP